MLVFNLHKFHCAAILKPYVLGMFSIPLLRLATGAWFPFPLIDDGFPSVSGTAFALKRWRDGRAPGTIAYQLRAVDCALDWARRNGINFEGRCRTREFFDEDELQELREALRIPRVQNGRKHLRPVANETLAARWDFVLGYMVFLARKSFTRSMSINSREAAKEQIRHFIELYRSFRPSVSSADLSPVVGLPTADARALFGTKEDGRASAFHPEHPKNPFINHRERNYALFTLLYWHTFRISEVLNLKRDDLDLTSGKNILKVRRRPDDPINPSHEDLKTGIGGVVALEEVVASALADWLIVRRGYLKPQQSRYPYLFISERGRKLSRRQAHNLFQEARKALPELGPTFAAHVLRHDWNERYVEEALARRGDKRWSPLDALDVDHQEEQNRWVTGSKMSGRYSHRAHAKRSGKRVMARAKEYEDLLEDEE